MAHRERLRHCLGREVQVQLPLRVSLAVAVAAASGSALAAAAAPFSAAHARERRQRARCRAGRRRHPPHPDGGGHVRAVRPEHGVRRRLLVLPPPAGEDRGGGGRDGRAGRKGAAARLLHFRRRGASHRAEHHEWKRWRCLQVWRAHVRTRQEGRRALHLWQGPPRLLRDQLEHRLLWGWARRRLQWPGRHEQLRDSRQRRMVRQRGLDSGLFHNHPQRPALQHRISNGALGPHCNPLISFARAGRGRGRGRRGRALPPSRVPTEARGSVHACRPRLYTPTTT